jgi:hypothetical protein
MSKTGEGEHDLPPTPKGDGTGGKMTPIDEDSKNPRMEQLSSELKQPKLQRKIDKLKKKLKDSKSHEVPSSSSEEEVNDKKGKKGDKRSDNIASFNYDNLPHSSTLTSVPIGNPPPISMGQTILNGVTR